MTRLLWIFTLMLLLPKCKCHKPGPKLTLNRDNKTNQRWVNPDLRAKRISSRNDLTVVVNSYDMGITALAVAEAISEQGTYPELNPTLAYYHTSAYRWILRLLSSCMGTEYDKFTDIHKVWRQRFRYENVLVPEWIRNALAWVNKDTWDKEEEAFIKYNYYAKPEFDRYDRYPSEDFDSKQSESMSGSIYYPGPPGGDF